MKSNVAPLAVGICTGAVMMVVAAAQSNAQGSECDEGNYGLKNILSAARADDAKAAVAQSSQP